MADFAAFIRRHQHRDDSVGDAARAVRERIDYRVSLRELENELAFEAVTGAYRGIHELAELWQAEKWAERATQPKAGQGRPVAAKHDAPQQ